MTENYEPTWNSLARHQLAQWFRDAKFGVYTHWGVYSVPAFGANGTWYPHFMYGADMFGRDAEHHGPEFHRHHVETYGGPEEFGYKVHLAPPAE